MIDKQSQRFLKEGLISVFRKFPKAIKFPIYYLPIDDKPLKEIGLAVHSLHELPIIPFPEGNCIICTDDYLGKLLLPPSMHNFLVIVHFGKPKEEHDFLEVFVVVEHLHRLVVRQQKVEMTHRQEFTIFPSELVEESIERRISFFQNHGFQPDSHVVSELKDYWRVISAPSLKGCWTAKEISTTNDELSADTMGLASDILGYLSNIAIPCHYIVRSNFDGGFGPPSVKKITRDKPIFSVLSHSRIYQSLPESDRDASQVRPHHRRGHVRHHWALAGINRFQLPLDPMARIKIAILNHVPRSYVPPTWIGNRVFVQNNMRHEIVTHEMGLNNP